MVGAPALFGLAASLVQVQDTDCPSAAQVEYRLEALLPAAGISPDLIGSKALLSAVGGRPDREAPRSVAQRGPRLRVELRGPAGQVLVARMLEPAPCLDQAAAAAIILASALTAGPPSLSTGLPAPISLEAPRPPHPPPRLPWDVAVGLLLSAAPGAVDPFAPGALLEASLAPRGWALGVRLYLSGTGRREQPIGGSAAAGAWTRLVAGAGPRYRLGWGLPATRSGNWLLDLHAEGLVAAVLVNGQGLSRTYSSADVDLGLGGGARLLLAWGPLAPFVGAAVAGWLRPQQLLIAGASSSAELPRFEVLVLLGLAVGSFP